MKTLKHGRNGTNGTLNERCETSTVGCRWIIQIVKTSPVATTKNDVIVYRELKSKFTYPSIQHRIIARKPKIKK